MNATQTKTPQEIAREAADRYFAALACEIPCDTAPGAVNLIEAANEIQDAINASSDRQLGWETQSAMEAGYFLGVEVGRRLGAAR